MNRRLATNALGRVMAVSAAEMPALIWSFIYFFCLLGSYYILRPVRDEMGIRGGVDQLQWLFTGTFVAMALTVPIFGWLASRCPRRTLLPIVYAFFIANILAFYALFEAHTENAYVARAFFIWLSVFNLFVVSVFWSFMADIFRTDQAKRLFAIIAAGGSAGAMTGPVLTSVLVIPLGTNNLLPIAAALLCGALLCITRLRRWSAGRPGLQATDALGGGIFEGVMRILQSRYLLGICGYIVLYTTVATFLYFTQARIVEEAFTTSAERTRVFALMDLAVNTLTIILQLLATGRLVTRFGIALALALIPGLLMVGLVILSLAPTLAVLVVVQVVRRAGNFAIARPAREMLFTVLPRRDKYKSKNVIDTLVYRGGDAVSGWVYAAMAGVGVGLASIALVGVPVALAWLIVGWWLGRTQSGLAAAGRPA